MGESASLVVEMIDDTIVVTLPGTDVFASYRKRNDVGKLAAHLRAKQITPHPSPPRRGEGGLAFSEQATNSGMTRVVELCPHNPRLQNLAYTPPHLVQFKGVS